MQEEEGRRHQGAPRPRLSGALLTSPLLGSFIAVENIDSYCVLISSKAVYFLKSGDYVDREAIFLEVKYDDLYHCLVSKDHGKVYVQVTKKAGNTSSGVSIPGPSQQKPMVSAHGHPSALLNRVVSVRGSEATGTSTRSLPSRELSAGPGWAAIPGAASQPPTEELCLQGPARVSACASGPVDGSSGDP